MNLMNQNRVAPNRNLNLAAKHGGEIVIEAVKTLIDSNSHARTSDEHKLKNCVVLLRRAPATRKAVLEIISKCVEKNVLRLPHFKKNMEELRQRDYSNKADDASLKHTISELNQLIVDSPKFWSVELSIWAIQTIARIGTILGAERYPSNSLIEVTQFWMDQEVTSKLSHIIVSGILYGFENNDIKIMEILMKEAFAYDPYLDWILACISISKPKVILNKLLDSGFSVFLKNDGAEEKREHLRALTCILEYLVEKKPELVGSCLFGILEVNEKFLLLKSLYILELLKTSLKSDKIGLIYKIGKQISHSLTPKLITALHQQKKTDFSEIDMNEIKNSIAMIMSGSSCLDITRVFVAISNGDGDYASLDMEIKLVFRSILGSILNKLEETAFDTRTYQEVIRKNIIEDYNIPSNITATDPSYRLLRLILFSSNQETCVDAMSKVLTTVNTPQGQTALIQLLKESHLIHSNDFIKLFINKAFESNSSKLVLLDNLYVLVEDINESSQNYDSGRKLLSKNIRQHLILEISQVMELIDSNTFELVKSALNLIDRLKIDQSDVPPVSNMLLIETLMKLFFTWLKPDRTVEVDDLFTSTWKLLYNLSGSKSSFALILRKTIEKLKRLSDSAAKKVTKHVKEKVDLLKQVQCYSSSGSHVMGVGQVGDGVKRIKICRVEEDRLSDVNYALSIFITSIVFHEKSGKDPDFDRINTLSGFLKELFCSSFVTGETDWPSAILRGQVRLTLEKDIILVKSLPLNIFSLLDVLSLNWEALNRVSVILRAIFNTQLAFWEASRLRSTSVHPEKLQESVRIVTILGKAKMIPSILAETSEIYEFVSPYELFLLLNAIWGFLHCNPISQVLINSNFENCNVDLYLTDARNILLKNIDKTSHIYHKFG